MKEMVLVSQLNWANVLSRAGEGRDAEGKIQKEHDIVRRKQTEASKILKWKCGNSNSVIENIVDFI